MKTSIIILTYDNLSYTKMCIESIRKYTKKDFYEIVVIDNNSSDGTIEWLKAQGDIKTVFNKKNLGFPKGCNQGISISTGDNILLLNNDVLVTPNWLDNLVNCLYSSKDIGAVGPITNFASNYQNIDVKFVNNKEIEEFSLNYNKSNHLKWEERLRLIGFCMLIKREVVEKVGLLDEIFTPGIYEDDDYSLRIRKNGYKLILCKDTYIHHFGSATFKKDVEKFRGVVLDNKKKFEEKWAMDHYKFCEVRFDVINEINEFHNNFRIMHIGCGSGGTLLSIGNRFRCADLYGIEENKNLLLGTEIFAHIDIGNLDILRQYSFNFFQYIICTLNLYSIKEFGNTALVLEKYLVPSGELIILLPKEVDMDIKDADKYAKNNMLKNFSYCIKKTYDGFWVKLTKNK